MFNSRKGIKPPAAPAADPALKKSDKGDSLKKSKKDVSKGTSKSTSAPTPVPAKTPTPTPTPSPPPAKSDNTSHPQPQPQPQPTPQPADAGKAQGVGQQQQPQQTPAGAHDNKVEPSPPPPQPLQAPPPFQQVVGGGSGSMPLGPYGGSGQAAPFFTPPPAYMPQASGYPPQGGWGQGYPGASPYAPGGQPMGPPAPYGSPAGYPGPQGIPPQLMGMQPPGGYVRYSAVAQGPPPQMGGGYPTPPAMMGGGGPPHPGVMQQGVTGLADQLQQLDLQKRQAQAAAAGAPVGGMMPQAHVNAPQLTPDPSGGTAAAPALSEDTWEIDYSELEISREIARGSFGIVYQAMFRGTEVAVKKLIQQKLSAEQMQEFVSEINIMKKLHHPNVLLLIGVCTKESNLCIVTEFMTGSMWNLLHDKNVRLDWKLQHKLMVDTAKGMNYLHLFKPPVLHRDLKSPNLLVDQNFNVKIADFGLARIKASMMTSNLGTCQYMAPEVIQSNTYTEKADVFSYGVVMWEIMTRQPPYQGMQPMQIAYGIVHSNLRPPIGPSIPQAVAALMAACWHQDPAQRPSFTEVLARLKSIPV